MPDNSPDERPVRRRTAARVIVVAGDEVLLMGDTDPGVPGSRFWQAPGGGIDPGEDAATAAARELEEETGLVVDPRSLAGPVAVRHLVRGYSDRILVQDETFYLLRTEKYEPVPTGLSESEQSRHIESRWTPLDQLPPLTWPAEIAQWATWDGEVIDAGSVEESTVPVGRALRA